MQAAVSAIAELPGLTDETNQGDRRHAEEWFPRSRQVQRLFECYLGHRGQVISSVFEDGVEDLACLDVPPGLGQERFNAFIAARLQALSYVAVIDAQAKTSIDRAHGQALLVALGFAKASPSFAEWDTIASWLVTFLPTRFRYKNTFTGPAIERSQVIR
jgi:hypothetical protein